MSRTFITLFFVLAISSVGVLSQETASPCGRNQVWDECNGNPNCQPTCDNPNPACPKICVAGCVCIPNYLRDRNNLCIPEGCCNWDVD